MNDRGFLRHDLSLTCGDEAVLEPPHDPVAETDPAACLAQFDSTAESAPGLLGQLLQEQCIHRPLEANVQVGDVAFSERDDVHTSEREALE